MAITNSDAAKIFKALSDENRLSLVLSLTDGEKSATELLKAMPFSQPTLSHHLSLLCESGVVIARRDGKTVNYRINTEAASILSDISASLAASPSEPAKKSAPIKAKRAPAPRKPREKKEDTPEPPKEETPVRRTQVFDFFD